MYGVAKFNIPNPRCDLTLKFIFPADGTITLDFSALVNEKHG